MFEGVAALLLLVSRCLCTNPRGFTEIGAKFGPFDLSFVPIWRGGTLGWISWAGLRVRHLLSPSPVVDHN